MHKTSHASTDLSATSDVSGTAAPTTVSNAGIIVTPLACLMTGERNLNLVPDWKPVNEEQRTFLEIGGHYRGIVLDGGLPIETKFSDNSDDVNLFLEERDISVKLKPCGPDEYAMAAVMKLIVSWIVKGKRVPMQIGDRVVNGAQIARDPKSRNMSFFTVEGHGEALVELKTVEGYTFTLTTGAELVGKTSLELFVHGLELLAARAKDQDGREAYYGGVIFPRCEGHIEVDISYLVGMNTLTRSGRKCTVTQAVAQVNILMDFDGATIVEAAAVKMSLESAGPRDLVLDGTLFVMVQMEGGELVNTFLLGPNVWSDYKPEPVAKPPVEEPQTAPEATGEMLHEPCFSAGPEGGSRIAGLMANIKRGPQTELYNPAADSGTEAIPGTPAEPFGEVLRRDPSDGGWPD